MAASPCWRVARAARPSTRDPALWFVLLALAFSRMAGAIGWVRRHYVWVMRIGGGMLIIVGLLLVTGLWTDLTVWLRVQIPGFETPL